MGIQRWVTNKFYGMKQVENPTVSLPMEYANKIENYYIADGVLVKRTGCTKKNSASVASGSISVLKEVIWKDDTKSILVQGGSVLYNGGADCTTLTSVQTGIGNAKLSISQFPIANVTYSLITGKNYRLQKYDNATLSDLFDNLNTFLKDKVLTLETGENNTLSLAIDSTATYVYAGLATNPAKIIKILLSDFSRYAVLTLNAGEISAESLAINSTHLYIGCNSGIVVKVQLSDFTRVGQLVLSTTTQEVRALAINSTHVYAALPATPSIVCKIQLSDFTEAAHLDLNANEDSAITLAINTTHLYVGVVNAGTYLDSAVVKIQLSDFTRVEALATTNTKLIYSLAINSTHLYTGHFHSTSVVVGKITLSNFSTQASLTLASYTNPYVVGLAVDDNYLYATGYQTPETVYKVLLSDFATITTLALATGENRAYAIVVSAGQIYVGLYDATPGKIVSINSYIIAKFIEVHESKVHLFGLQSQTERLYGRYSATEDCTDWTAANDAGYLTLGTVIDTYDTPMGLKSWGNLLIFFFKNNILIYEAGTDPNLFALRQHIKGVGSLSNGIISIGDDLWFPSRNGIKSLKLTTLMREVSTKNVSEDIDLFWTANITNYGTNTDRIQMVYDKIRDLFIVLSNASNSQGVTFYIYSVKDKAWSYFKILGLGTNVDVTALTATQDGLIYFGTSDGYIYELFSGSTDNSITQTFTYEPVVLFFNSTSFKKIKHIRLGIADTITAGTVSYIVDKSTTTRTVSIAKTVSGTYGLEYTVKYPIQNRGRSWWFQFLDCGSIRQLEYYGEVQSDK